MGTSKLRLGVIGLGVMGRHHATVLAEGKIEGAELTAVCDGDPALLSEWEEKANTFATSDGLIASGEVDAVIIATPHFSHTTIGADAFAHNLHVLVEKPISVHKADCERLLVARRGRDDIVFAVMFNMRTYPLYQKVKAMIDSGELGRIQRVNWIITTWFRTDAYYASGGWRATWAGEGGGVLLNQCPHQLDLFQWFFGMPSRLRAFCRFGQYHDIEVEDDVTAYLEWEDGKTGVVVATTGEAPGTNRLEITADLGKLVVENDEITFVRNAIPASECKRTGHRTEKPQTEVVSIPTDPPNGAGHRDIIQNFVDSVLKQTPLIAAGEEGIYSVELANAMLYSTFRDRMIELPLDSEAYAAALNEKIATSATP